MVGGLTTKAKGTVLDVIRQRGGAQPHATVLHDHSPFGNDGAFLGAGEPAWVQLPSGLWVLDFDPVNDIITVPYNPIFNFGTSWTVIQWILFRTITAARDYLRRTGWFQIYRIAPFGAGQIRLLVNFTGGGGSESTTLTVEQDVFHFLAFGVSPQGVFFTQLNEVYNQENLVGFTGMPADNTNAITIGLRADSLIGLVRIYNYALSAGQILKRYEATRSLFGV